MHFDTDEPIDGESASLPDTMACLLGSAIEDASKLDRTIYTPHFDKWHQPYNANRCFVCLAGSFIARTLEIDPADFVLSRSFDDRTRDLLEAIDQMRYGRWSEAFRLVYRRAAPSELHVMLNRIPAPAHINFFGWQQFDKHLSSLEKIIPQLREIDLHALTL